MELGTIPWTSLSLFDSLLLFSGAVLFSTVAIALWCVVSYLLNTPLRRYPGPRLAALTNLWRFRCMRGGNYHKVTGELHKKYGPVVRVGPNVLDIDYPELLKTVFGISGEWRKTESVLASSSLVGGRVAYNLFSQMEPEIHARWKRPVAKFYSANGLTEFEGHIDKIIALLCEKLDERFPSGTGREKGGWSKGFDLGDWIRFYTWDSIGTLTFSQPLGYLASGADFDGTLSAAEKATDYFVTCYSFPILDRLMSKNPIPLFRKLGPPGFDPSAAVAAQRWAARAKGADKDVHSADLPDYLDKFLEAQRAHPDVIDDVVLFGYLMNNMIAGADTTAAALKSAIYHGLKDGKRVWTKLRGELARAGLSLGEGGVNVSYKAARAVPYLEAVIRESMRFHSPIGMGLERYVPEGGVTLPGEAGGYVPKGAVLAFNPAVLARNVDVYGQDADRFRPERWLRADGESQNEYEQRMLAMNNADFTFGGGSRICIGKHMALMQLYKLLASLVLVYDMELVDPEKEWRVIGSMFIRQEGLDVRIKRRL
ncbi:cytochrome P450 [Cladorrhinum samala]|uniref:Cytochrome P450 n=1 Tax=Cladorrhinum samala TaxID=585594 RepID=A0AAV9HM42_9PEZI|nr:cytochrome P450 [Cladorrhinum samala]